MEVFELKSINIKEEVEGFLVSHHDLGFLEVLLKLSRPDLFLLCLEHAGDCMGEGVSLCVCVMLGM